MCFGRPAQHIAIEKRRDEAYSQSIQAAAQKQRLAQEARMMEFQAEANRRQQEALAAIAASSKQPIRIKDAESAVTPIMRTKQKQSPTGLSSLRINRTPGTNVGMGASGTNIG